MASPWLLVWALAFGVLGVATWRSWRVMTAGDVFLMGTFVVVVVATTLWFWPLGLVLGGTGAVLVFLGGATASPMPPPPGAEERTDDEPGPR